ncbi:MAG: hypothetical protein CVU52_04940 [Deltaproteobacteria bacterium HGW-Deltaproteobacteria-10]|nr:MAG: hypothetical protein CVU52_04940 [Deltaproteobacteria bacterium HGW-Deltaproteobacteria-10]
MNWPRAFAIWFLIAAAESIHGALRGIFILPVIGDLRAHQFGILVGSLIIFAVAWACIRWIGAKTFFEQLKVGALWMVLMIIFEVSLGLALGYSRERIFADYNIVAGRLMIFGMIFILFAPALAAKARGFR